MCFLLWDHSLLRTRSTQNFLHWDGGRLPPHVNITIDLCPPFTSLGCLVLSSLCLNASLTRPSFRSTRPRSTHSYPYAQRCSKVRDVATFTRLCSHTHPLTHHHTRRHHHSRLYPTLLFPVTAIDQPSPLAAICCSTAQPPALTHNGISVFGTLREGPTELEENIGRNTPTIPFNRCTPPSPTAAHHHHCRPQPPASPKVPAIKSTPTHSSPALLLPLARLQALARELVLPQRAQWSSAHALLALCSVRGSVSFASCPS
jgi:hypothetical protein